MASIRVLSPVHLVVAGAVALGLFVGALTGWPVGRASAAGPPVGQVRVQAVGDSLATPDQLEVSIQVTEVRSTTPAALQAASQVLDRAFRVIRAHGVLRKDIKTTGVNVSPHYRYDSTGEHRDGYEADQSAQFLLTRLDTAGTVLAAMTRTAGNDLTISTATPTVSDTDPAKAMARADAIRVARAKAADYARLTGRHLGVVLMVSETVQPSAPSYPLRYAPTAQAASGSVAPRIQPGQQHVKVVVTTVWQLT